MKGGIWKPRNLVWIIIRWRNYVAREPRINLGKSLMTRWTPGGGKCEGSRMIIWSRELETVKWIVKIHLAFGISYIASTGVPNATIPRFEICS